MQIQNEPCSYKDLKNFKFAIKMSYLAILSLNQGLNLHKELYNCLELVKMYVSPKTKKTLTMRTKMAYFGIFRLKLEKSYCHI